MENAADALKMAFAIFVFILGLSILFTVTSQAKEAARVIITEIDPTTYYEYIDSKDSTITIDDNGNREVEFKDIIPVLYRYSEENYGVTIVNKSGVIVARFDLDTESICNAWLNTSSHNKYVFVSEMKNIFDQVNDLAKKINATKVTTNFEQLNPEKLSTDSYSGEITYGIDTTANTRMESLFKKLYGQRGVSLAGAIRRSYYCYWHRKYGMDSSKNRF